MTVREPDEEAWLNLRGHTMRADLWHPAQPPKGTVILVHGAGGNGRIVAPFAEAVCEAGWHVIAPDLPGYGLTRQAKAAKWDYAEWPLVVNDIAKTCDGPAALLGLSMGGLTSVYAASLKQDYAFVVATTLIDLTRPDHFIRASRFPILGHFGRFGMRFFPWVQDVIPMPLALVAPFQAMSSNAALQAYFRVDPFVGRKWLPLKFWRSVHRYNAPQLRTTVPIHVLHPGADTWTPTALSRSVFDMIDAPKSFTELSGGSHLFYEPGTWADFKSELTEKLV